MATDAHLVHVEPSSSALPRPTHPSPPPTGPDGGRESEVAALRAVFFRRTRTLVAAYYAGLAASALAAGAHAVSVDPVRGGGLIVVGLVAAVVMFGAGPRLPISARATRSLIVVGAIAGATVGATVVDRAASLIGDAGFYGGLAGFLLGTAVGIARIRRRLAWDDELLLRQKQLGFDPARPFAWLRDRT